MELIVSHLPIISTGMCLFLVGVFVCQLSFAGLTSSWGLSPQLLADFELSRLTTYPLIHFSPLHLVFNLVALWPVLATFERSHGSIHTAIVMNTTGAITGVVYSLVCLLTGISTEVLIGGASGWCFTFLTVDCMTRAVETPSVDVGGYKVPTRALPAAYLVLSAIVMPSSSFLGHLVALGVGLAVYRGILGPLCSPPFKIVERIEKWTPFRALVGLKDHFVLDGAPLFEWVSEEEAVEGRYKSPVVGLPF